MGEPECPQGADDDPVREEPVIERIDGSFVRKGDADEIRLRGDRRESERPELRDQRSFPFVIDFQRPLQERLIAQCADAGVAGDAKTAAISVCQKRFAELLPMGRG